MLILGKTKTIMRYIIAFTLLFSIQLSAQSTAKDEVKATIETFFKGFHKGDTLLMKTTMHDKLMVQTAYTNTEGKDILNDDWAEKLISAIGNRPAEKVWEEKLLSYSIQVDGIMANAWTEYEFWLNGKFSHCGVNSFQLFKDNGSWKIIYLIDTRRRKGCAALVEQN
jgi:hypothetical protein